MSARPQTDCSLVRHPAEISALAVGRPPIDPDLHTILIQGLIGDWEPSRDGGLSRASLTGNLMYQEFSRVFETSAVAIVKVTGQVKNSDIEAWSDFLNELVCTDGGWVVLDFSDVSRMGQKAVAMLVDLLPQQVLLLNCPPRNSRKSMDSAGFSRQVLGLGPAEHRGLFAASILPGQAHQVRSGKACCT